MNILAIGAHFDDVELGCGGSLLSWKKAGHNLTIFTASTSGYSDSQGQVVRDDKTAHREGKNVTEKLGAVLITENFPTFGLEFSEPLNCKLLNVLKQVNPELVLTHWSGDAHHDHRALALASIHTCRHVPKLLTYASNWYESDQQFNPRFFIDISQTLEEKVKLIEIYYSENTRTKGRWLDFVRLQARLMGLKSGVQYAEGFEVIRWRL